METGTDETRESDWRVIEYVSDVIFAHTCPVHAPEPDRKYRESR